MENAEQIVSNYQQLLGAANYEAAAARALAQQLAMQLSEARAEIEKLKQAKPAKGKSARTE